MPSTRKITITATDQDGNVLDQQTIRIDYDLCRHLRVDSVNRKKDTEYSLVEIQKLGIHHR